MPFGALANSRRRAHDRRGVCRFTSDGRGCVSKGEGHAHGVLLMVGLMVERAKALGVDHRAAERCAEKIRLASRLLDRIGR